MTSPLGVKTLLFISSTDKIYSRCFLFNCAKYWAGKGDNVLYITHEPMDDLPHSIGEPRSTKGSDNWSHIRFMYLPNWKDLLKECYSMHQQPNPASVIIVQELENYFVNNVNTDHDHTSLICASLLQAASVSAARNLKPSYLINGFNSKNSIIPITITKNFFHNVWRIHVYDSDGESIGNPKKLIRLSNLNRNVTSGEVLSVVFSENETQSVLEFEKVFQAVFR